MTDETTIQLPAPSTCAICDRQLATARQECPDCFGDPPAETGAVSAAIEVDRWLRRSRGWLLVGMSLFALVLPLAFRNAAQAMEAYDSGGLDDPELLWRIRLYQVSSVVILFGSLALVLAVIVF